MNQDVLNILIVGLGKVGMTYDLNGPSSQILTHTRAIDTWSEVTKFSVDVTGVDPDPETQEPLKKIFKSSQWFASMELLEFEKSFDLAIIATPISTIAFDTIQACERLNIKNVVIEKPAAKSLLELETLISLPGADTNFIVGFPRPFLPSSNYLKERIQSFGEEQAWKVDIHYGGSVLNILSHFLNLVEFLIEPFELESYKFDVNKYLIAIFKSETGRLEIRTHQYSKFNDEKNEIFIAGPINISYTNSGRDFRIDEFQGSSKGDPVRIDCHEEISQMVGVFGNTYLRWASSGVKSNFTYLTSSSLLETIRLAEAENVR